MVFPLLRFRAGGFPVRYRGVSFRKGNRETLFSHRSQGYPSSKWGRQWSLNPAWGCKESTMSIEPLSWERGSAAASGLAQPRTPTGAHDQHRWSVPARSADLGHIRTALTDPDSLGVVITG